MSALTSIIDFILHIDVHLQLLAAQYGILLYGILFLIIFAETGLVVAPFLPGDSLLFAAGAVAATGALDVHFLAILLVLAALLGDNVNYWVGHFLGGRLLNNPKARLFRQDYFFRAQSYFEHHGRKTLIMARFVPIVRTYVPFVAGTSQMPYTRFIRYSCVGAIAWVGICLYAGYLFGHFPLIKENFSVLVLAIIGLSLLPLCIAAVRKRG